METQIKPVQIWNKQATILRIDNVNVQLDNTASCQYVLLSDDGSELIRNGVSLTAEQYANWSNNDEYFVDCVLTNLQLERAQVE